MSESPKMSGETCPVEPEGGQAHLMDFIDLELLQRFQDHFARAVGVSVVIRDRAGNMVTRPSVPNRFCTLINSAAAGREHCKHSSVNLTLQAVKTGQVTEDTCHVGFHRFAAPIRMDETILGAMVIGEILEGPADEAHITAVALDLGLNPGELLDAAQELKVRSSSEIAISVDFVQFAASALAQLCFEGARLRRQLRTLQTVRGSGQLFGSPLDISEILQTVVRTVQHNVRVKAVGLRLLDNQTGELVIKAVVGLSEGYLRKGPVPLNASRIDQEVMQGGTIYIRDIRTDDRLLYPREMAAEGVRSLLVIPLRVKNRPIGVLRMYAAQERNFDETDLQLAEVIAAQSAIAVENARLYQDALTKERLERELKLAAQIQSHLLPKTSPELPGLDIAAASLPCRAVGGDFFDFLSLANGHTGIVIADVCGKSVGGALLMAATRSSVRVQAEHILQPAELVERLNRSLVRDTRPAEFVTLLYGVLDAKGRSLTYTNAGHNPGLLYRDGEVLKLATGGMVCGVIEPTPYEQETTKLRQGDILVLYTDGLNEARNVDEELFGLERLHAIVAEHPEEPATDLLQRIVGAVQQFSRPREQSDDLTIVLIKVL